MADCDRLVGMTHNELVKHVRRRIKEMGLTPYQLHKRVEDRLNKQTIYNFIRHGRVIKSDTLLVILAELGFVIGHKRKRTKP